MDDAEWLKQLTRYEGERWGKAELKVPHPKGIHCRGAIPFLALPYDVIPLLTWRRRWLLVR
jgi:hypothetical protein